MANITDAEEVREILSVVSTEVPKLLSAISEALFSAEQADKFAQAVADFYKRLRDAGMDEGQAFQLTESFMDKTNFAAMIQDVLSSQGIGRRRRKKVVVEGDLNADVENVIKEKIREEFADHDEDLEEE